MGYKMKNPGIGKLIRGNILGEQAIFSRVEKKDDQGYRYLNMRPFLIELSLLVFQL